MSDSKHERDDRAEAVRALMLIREQCADVNAWQVWAANGDFVEAYPNELLDHITALTQRAEAAEAKLRDVAYWHEAWKEAEAEREALRNIILWALGENGEFPERPRSDSHNLYPFYWWRTEMRKRLDTAMAVQPTTGDKHE